MVIVLGCDIGTTSAKVNCIQYDKKNDHFKVLQRASLAYHQHLKSEKFSDLNEDNLSNQVTIKVGLINPFLILSTLTSCIEEIDVKIREQVQAVGICGQMHGVLYWNKKSLQKIRLINSDVLNFNLKFNKNYQNFVSNLHTWEDSRCDKKFLDQLPNNQNFENKKDKKDFIHSGYGVATTFWWIKNDPNYLNNSFDYMGSIMDFLIHLLCIDLDHPVTSVQLANSYGYFDMKTNDWSTHLYDKKFGFPNHLLPRVLSENQKAGTLKYKFLRINENVPVFVACGDLQCVIYSAMTNHNQTAILNSGTSLQLAFPIKTESIKEIKSNALLELLNSKINLSIDSTNEPSNNLTTESSDSIPHLDIVPYFDGNYLATMNSLTGGNVISFFVKSIENIINDLFDETEIRLDEPKLWSRLTGLAKNYVEKKKKFHTLDQSDEGKDELNVEPRLFGERFERIKSKFSINSISSSTNFELGRLYYALCLSIIENVFKMCPVYLLKEVGIETISASGSTMKNEILRLCLEQKLAKDRMNLIYADDVEADLGIAMVTVKNFLNLNQLN